MACKSAIADYSGLQLLEFDAAANAPQRGCPPNLPELDCSAIAPEACRNSAPLIYDAVPWQDHGPELYQNEHQRISINAPGFEKPNGHDKPTARKSGISRRRLWLLACVTLLGAIAVAVGVGVGVGRPKSPSLAPNSPDSHGYKYFIEDTSLAAVLDSDGQPHLFAQDSDGSLSWLTYSETQAESAKQWRLVESGSKYQALNNTPRSVVLQQKSNLTDGQDWIILFYLTPDGSFAVEVKPASGGSIFGGPLAYKSLSPVGPAYGKALSAALIPDTDAIRVLLYLGRLDFSISIFDGSLAGSGTWDWENVTNVLASPIPALEPPPGVVDDLSNFSIPLTSFTYLNKSQPKVCSYLFNPQSMDLNQTFLFAVYSEDFLFGLLASPSDAGFIGPTIADVDYAQRNCELAIASYSEQLTMSFALCNHSLSTFDGGTPNINAIFPYSKLATASSAQNSTFYLYHQTSNEILTENAWDGEFDNGFDIKIPLSTRNEST